MTESNQKLIVSGIALLLFGITIAIVEQSSISYVFGVLGVSLVVLGCYAK